MGVYGHRGTKGRLSWGAYARVGMRPGIFVVVGEVSDLGLGLGFLLFVRAALNGDILDFALILITWNGTRGIRLEMVIIVSYRERVRRVRKLRRLGVAGRLLKTAD